MPRDYSSTAGENESLPRDYSSMDVSGWSMSSPVYSMLSPVFGECFLQNYEAVSYSYLYDTQSRLFGRFLLGRFLENDHSTALEKYRKTTNNNLRYLCYLLFVTDQSTSTQSDADDQQSSAIVADAATPLTPCEL